MTIGNYSQVLKGSKADLKGHVLGLNSDNVIARKPLNPPSAWTHFKAGLSNLPAFGRIGQIRQARAKVETYPVKLAEYETNNRKILVNLRKDLTESFGSEFAEMTLSKMHAEEGKPLSLYAVSIAVASGKRLQEQYKSHNNIRIENFLETDPGSLIESNMTATYLTRPGLVKKLGRSTWEDAFGPGATKFLSKHVKACCQKLSTYAQADLTNSDLAAAANAAFALYEELLAVPGMTRERLDEILDTAAQQPTVDQLTGKAREDTIMDKVTPMLNRKPGSFLHTEAQEAAKRFGVPGLPEAVLKSISNGMDEFVRFAARDLSLQFGCAPDATSVIAALTPRLKENVIRALNEHCETLKMIDASTTLNDAQKDKLREIAGSRRMDPVQVAEYEKVAGKINEVFEASARLAYNTIDPTASAGALMGAVHGAIRQFETSTTAMKKHGHDFWEPNSLDGGEMTQVLTSQCAELAAASLSDLNAGQFHQAMRNNSMNQFLQASAQSGNQAAMLTVTPFIGEVMLAIGKRVGGSEEVVLKQIRDMFQEVEAASDVPSTLPQGMLQAVKDASSDWKLES